MADYLIHFNKNHDPKTGRFTFSSGKDLYKSIKRDAIIGKFDPKNYKSNMAINEAINNSNVKSLKRKSDRLDKAYEAQQNEQRLKDALYDRYFSKQSELQKKYYNELKKPHMTKDEKYNIYERALWKAEDEMSADPQYTNAFSLVDRSKLKGISIADISKMNVKFAEKESSIAKEILGKYADKKIRTLKTNTRARFYVEQIIREILEE